MYLKKAKTRQKLILSSVILALIPVLNGCSSNDVKTVQTSNTTPTNNVLTTKEKYLLDRITATSIETTAVENRIPEDSLTLQPEVDHFDNLWNEVTSNLALTDQHQGRFDEKIKFYNKRKTHIKKVAERARPYLHYIFTEVKKRDMPYEIALLPMVESGFNATARSHKKAAGLWQFIPSTGDIFGLDRTWWYDGRKDVIKSTHAALDYLQKLHKLNNGDWLLALASYNAGLGNVYKAQKKYRKRHNGEANYWNISPYLPRETRNYVPKLFATAHLFRFPEKYGLEIEPLANKPYFTSIDLATQIELKQLAKHANVTHQTLTVLNPGFLQAATPPKGKHHLLLPVEESEQLAYQLNANKHLFTVEWQRHKIKSGDSLSRIAQRYGSSTRAIKSLNRMTSSRIIAGKTLLIPVTKGTQPRENKGSSNPRLTSVAGHFMVHNVVSGDSVWKIAKKYNVSRTDLYNWNNLSKSAPLKIGQSLRVSTPEPKGVKIIHTLQKGESLWTLAKRYSTNTHKIALWNGIQENTILQPGMKFTVWTNTPVKAFQVGSHEYIVQTGDNLWEIAQANQISAKELASHNNINLKSLLKPGQVLKIPAKS